MQRVAFPPKSNSKSPVEANIDIIIKTSNLKMKEFMLKKQENEKQTNLIQGQNIQLENQIAHLLEERNEKLKQIQILENVLKDINNDISHLEEDYNNLIESSMKNDEMIKENMNDINMKLNGIEYGALSEKSKKKFEIKKYIEMLYKIKKENNLLKDLYQRKNSELYRLEVLEKDEQDKEKVNELKAKKGIKDINALYELGMKKGMKLAI